MPTLRIGLIGDRDPTVTAHRAIEAALERAAHDASLPLVPVWHPTASIGDDAAAALAGFHGLWCVPASPYANTAGALRAIRVARETPIPFLGTCAGFQHALLEYAESVWGVDAPAHAELDPQADDPLIARLECALVERAGGVVLVQGTRLAAIYGTGEAIETYHCRYGLSAHWARRLDTGPLRVAARDTAGDVRAVELDGHPFFLATLFQPERAALAGRAHPLIAAFVRAAAERAVP